MRLREEFYENKPLSQQTGKNLQPPFYYRDPPVHNAALAACYARSPSTPHSGVENDGQTLHL